MYWQGWLSTNRNTGFRVMMTSSLISTNQRQVLHIWKRVTMETNDSPANYKSSILEHICGVQHLFRVITSTVHQTVKIIPIIFFCQWLLFLAYIYFILYISYVKMRILSRKKTLSTFSFVIHRCFFSIFFLLVNNELTHSCSGKRTFSIVSMWLWDNLVF